MNGGFRVILPMIARHPRRRHNWCPRISHVHRRDAIIGVRLFIFPFPVSKESNRLYSPKGKKNDR